MCQQSTGVNLRKYVYQISDLDVEVSMFQGQLLVNCYFSCTVIERGFILTYKKDIICGIQMMFVFALYLRFSKVLDFNHIIHSDFSVK